jgi:DNA-binding NtrC family response regulator
MEQNTDFKYPHYPVLIVDDEPETTEGYEILLQAAGVNHLVAFNDSRKVMEWVETNPAAAILLDLCMPHLSGEELLETLIRRYPDIPVIVITGINEIETAVNCMRTGAFDYMRKPIEERRLIGCVRRAVDHRELQLEFTAFRQLVFNDDLNHPEAFSRIVTRNKIMRSVFQYVESIAGTRKPVLITGSSGVGKGLIAEAIHTVSGCQGPFIAVNISGLDDNLFSDTLFGHLKGAFPGADNGRQGLVEQAGQGTLFLDEIGGLSSNCQIKLLRLLEERAFYPLGADVPREVSARIITATNRDIRELQKNHHFRTDLYFRLQTHHLHLPDLKDRKDDLALLVDHFLEAAAAELGKKKPTPPKALYALLSSYDFPGNVRELQSMVYDAVSHHHSHMLSMERFRAHMESHGSLQAEQGWEQDNGGNWFCDMKKLPSLKQARRILIEEALRRSAGNQAVAAQMLGITRSGLNKLIKRHEN